MKLVNDECMTHTNGYDAQMLNSHKIQLNFMMDFIGLRQSPFPRT